MERLDEKKQAKEIIGPDKKGKIFQFTFVGQLISHVW